jgi:hypothetical protein
MVLWSQCGRIVRCALVRQLCCGGVEYAPEGGCGG